MPCYHPLEGYRARIRNPSGKRGIVFSLNLGYRDLPVTVPCGQCIGCRLERSRQWAVRCVHEASLHSDNCFVTLTYNPAKLPQGGTLVKKDFQTFMKRLRKKYGLNIRYFHCGEYGEEFRRPHYHAIIFNKDFQDRVLYSENNGSPLYTSASLQALWPHGFATIGDVTFESAAYVARYVLKKINKEIHMTEDSCPGHYSFMDKETGEISPILPEYVTMSLKPAIGKLWYEKFHSDVFPSDEIIMRGKQLKPPKYYDKLQELADPQQMAIIKGKRVQQSTKNKSDNTPRRLADKEICKLAKIKTLSRSLI